MNSRAKGKRGELLAVASFRDELGIVCRRSAQCQGIGSDGDLTGLDGVHVEVKVGAAWNVEKAMRQAERDARDGAVPCVWGKRDRCEPVIIVRASEFHRLAKSLAALKGDDAT